MAFSREGGHRGGGGGFGRGGGDRRGGGGGFRRDRFGPREMHNIKCSNCGKEDQVPFKPREGAAVYCKECFAKRKNAEREQSDDSMGSDSEGM